MRDHSPGGGGEQQLLWRVESEVASLPEAHSPKAPLPKLREFPNLELVPWGELISVIGQSVGIPGELPLLLCEEKKAGGKLGEWWGRDQKEKEIVTGWGQKERGSGRHGGERVRNGAAVGRRVWEKEKERSKGGENGITAPASFLWVPTCTVYNFVQKLKDLQLVPYL